MQEAASTTGRATLWEMAVAVLGRALADARLLPDGIIGAEWWVQVCENIPLCIVHSFSLFASEFAFIITVWQTQGVPVYQQKLCTQVLLAFVHVLP